MSKRIALITISLIFVFALPVSLGIAHPSISPALVDSTSTPIPQTMVTPQPTGTLTPLLTEGLQPSILVIKPCSKVTYTIRIIPANPNLDPGIFAGGEPDLKTPDVPNPNCPDAMKFISVWK